MDKSAEKRVNDAKQYLKQHNIQKIFEDLTTALIVYQPDEPLVFLTDLLDKLQHKEELAKLNEKIASVAHPEKQSTQKKTTQPVGATASTASATAPAPKPSSSSQALPPKAPSQSSQQVSQNVQNTTYVYNSYDEDALKGELNLESKRRTSRPASNQNARPESKERYSRPTSSGGVGAGSGSRPYSSQEERASRQATNRMLADPEDEDLAGEVDIRSRRN